MKKMNLRMGGDIKMPKTGSEVGEGTSKSMPLRPETTDSTCDKARFGPPPQRMSRHDGAVGGTSRSKGLRSKGKGGGPLTY